MAERGKLMAAIRMIRAITITPVLNGFIVEVGCQKVVFTSLTALGHDVVRYYTDSRKIEEEYRKNAVNPECLANEVLAMPTRSPAESLIINQSTY
jgi:hypothetical protein